MTLQRRIIRTAALVLLPLAWACGDSSGPKVGPPATLIVLTTGALNGQAGQALEPIGVRVRDGTGQNVPNVAVAFTVTAGGGSVSSPQVSTNAEGTAQVTWTLGTQAGAAQTLEARVDKQDGSALRVTFTATAAPGPPAALAQVSGNDQRGAVAAALRDTLVVRVTDAHGNPVAGVAVSWSAASGSIPASTTTNAAGIARAQWTLGTTLGPTTAQATATGLAPVTFTARADPGPAATLTITPSTITLDPGATQVLTAVARDAFQNPITERTVTWSTGQSLIATVQPDGTVRGVAGGTTNITAALDGRQAQAAVTVTGAPAAVPTITGMTPAVLTPGAVVQISGQNFTAGTGANTVQIAGVSAVIEDATASSVRARLPNTGFGCAPTRVLPLTLVTGGTTLTRDATLQIAPARTLTSGAPIIATAADALTCVELPADGGRYLVAVTNTSTNANSVSSLRVRGVSAGSASGTVTQLGAAQLTAPSALDPMRERRRQHFEILERNQRMLEGMLQAGPRPQPRLNALAQQAVPNVGDTLTIRIPGQTNSCNNFTEVRTRVAHVGQKSVVVEEVGHALANTLDSIYVRLANDFDANQYEQVRRFFGDPLRLDATLDNNGRLLIVFSSRVPTNATGFFFPGDLLERSACAQSNRAEVFYGFVPNDARQEYVASGSTVSVGAWKWIMPATVVHEVKHIASAAARLANGFSTAEAAWLEESTAMMVEELWAREVFGWMKGGNTGYIASVGCEIRGALNVQPGQVGYRPECVGKPGVTWLHFGFLADWLESPGQRSFLNAVGDPSFYGSGWFFLRWLLDHAAQSEEVLLRALNEASESGVANIQARFGRPFTELLPEWAIAAALDDRAGITVPGGRFHVPSWNLRDVYNGLSIEQPQSYPVAFPLTQVAFTYGNTQFDGNVRGGGAAYYELSGTPAGGQALEFTSAGQPLSGTLRISITRLQ